MAKTKAELLAEAEAQGVRIPASKKKAEIEEILADASPPVPEADELPDDAPASDKAIAALDDPEAPLAHTPLEPLTEYAPLGEPVPDLGPPADDADDAEGVAKDDAEEPLEATPHEVTILDTTVGSARPEDGAAAE